MASVTVPTEARTDEAARRRPLRELIVAARMIHRSGLTDAHHAGQILYRFLVLEAAGRPLGRALEKPFGKAVVAQASPPASASKKPRETTPPQNNESAQLWCDKLDARGLDTRSLGRVLDEEVAGLTSFIAGKCDDEGLEALEPLNVFQAINHLVTASVDNGAELRPFQTPQDIKVRRPPGECLAVLVNLYGGVWRDWLRHELVDYLERKRREAEHEIERQVYGDAPIDPEEESQEPRQAAEDESQLIPAGAGDAYEPPPRR